ncbi:MAG TPA: DinB family protein [Gemmatimonadaceae bacterium]|nr:DinB family protein [Gemmatimonadaceae bacterium]
MASLSFPSAPSAVRPGADEYLAYYARYIDRVPDGDILAHLEGQIEDVRARLGTFSEERAGFRYAPGKWSVREVVGHMIDVERVMAHRALRFARADVTPLPGFDENAWIAPAGFDARALASLLDEAAAVRAATLALFRNLPEEAWSRGGEANGAHVTVRALAWIIAGHERHHLTLIEERYR